MSRNAVLAAATDSTATPMQLAALAPGWRSVSTRADTKPLTNGAPTNNAAP